MQIKKRMSVGDLNVLYDEADLVDKAVFAEQRSNILLIAGEHYSSSNLDKYSNLRTNAQAQQKIKRLRIMKNHSYKVHRRYKSSVLQNANGVKIAPQLEYEIQDQKAAELNQSVWDYIKDNYKIGEKTRRWASDFCGIGEVFLKLFWNPDKGDFIGYNQSTSADGAPLFNNDGSPMPDNDSPVFSGKLEFERVFGFNILRDPSAKEMEESPYLIYRKLADTKELRVRYRERDDVIKSLDDGASEEYIIFDSNKNSYDRAKGKTPIREYYFRPCAIYPRGYFYIATKGAVLEEGELPEGIFPIVHKAFDENQTSPRGRSVQKQARPYQAEINRASSSQAMHQITIGDDKILYQAGTKLAPGSLLPGVRGITYQGMEPKILPGRDGAQYTGYIDSQKAEMYDVLDVNNLFQQGQEVKGGNDLYALLFRSASQRQQLSEYSEKFEEFLVDVCKVALQLAKAYFPEDILVPAIGRRELVNMAEFKSTTPMNFQIKVVPQDNTLETQFGKQMTFQHLMQYSGQQLSRQDIGMLMRTMPYSNTEEQFKEYTLDYDNVKNLMLALDRGEYPESIAEENHDYIVSKLSSRMRQGDFKFLPPQVQQMYAQKRMEHQQLSEEARQRLIAEQAEYIPADGPMIACEMYVEDSTDPSKAPKRARIPQNALNWLVKMLESQSGPLSQLEQANLGELRNLDQGPPGQMMPQENGMPPAAMGGLMNMMQ